MVHLLPLLVLRLLLLSTAAATAPDAHDVRKYHDLSGRRGATSANIMTFPDVAARRVKLINTKKNNGNMCNTLRSK